MCISRRELSNEYLLAKIGFDTAENEPCKVCLIDRSGRCGDAVERWKEADALVGEDPADEPAEVDLAVEVKAINNYQIVYLRVIITRQIMFISKKQKHHVIEIEWFSNCHKISTRFHKNL